MVCILLWRSLFKNSPHLCVDANITTVGFKGKYSQQEAVDIFRHARIMVMGEMVEVSYDVLFASKIEEIDKMNPKSLLLQVISSGLKRRHNINVLESDSDDSNN